MSPPTSHIVPLCELLDGQEADFFALLKSKEELKTRDGKPYYRVGFCDAGREVNFPIWGDSAWAVDCRDAWQVGEFYKLRGEYRETNYGPQIEIRKIRGITEADADDGFDPMMCQQRSRYDSQEMFDELVSIAEERIDGPLQKLVLDLLGKYREQLLEMAAASHNHHAFVGGYLEHVRSVTRTCIYLADKYADYYDTMDPPLRKDLIAAGGILHDIGKLRELVQNPEGAAYTSSGSLIGHILQGRDMVREAAADSDIDAETLLRLEHIVVAHQRLPEWGSPKPPMTPEAMIVHYADDLDAKLHMMVNILADDSGDGSITSNRNPLRQSIYRGEQPADEA